MHLHYKLPEASEENILGEKRIFGICLSPYRISTGFCLTLLQIFRRPAADLRTDE